MRKIYYKGLTFGLAGIILMSAIYSVQTNEDLLELFCLNEAQCKHFANNNTKAVCMEGHCRCMELATGNHTDCQPLESKLTNIISGPCPCSTPNSKCNKQEHKCYCAEGFIASQNLRHCLHTERTLYDECELDTQCQKADNFAICDPYARVCKCEHEVEVAGKCVFLADNIPCKKNETCQSNDSRLFCDDEHKVCVCAEGYVYALPKNNQKAACLPGAEYNGTCLSNEECQLTLGRASECSEQGKCICAARHYKKISVKTGKRQISCEPRIEVGQYCYQDSDCYQHDLSNDEQTMHCFFAGCKCKEGFLAQSDGLCKSKTNASTRLWYNATILITFMHTILLLLKELN